MFKNKLRYYDVFGEGAGNGLRELLEVVGVAFAVIGIGAEAYFEDDVLAVEMQHCKAMVGSVVFGFYATNIGS